MFIKSKDIYTDTNLDFFNQIDLGVYSKDIYTTVSLNSYVSNDPVEIHKKNCTWDIFFINISYKILFESINISNRF